MEMVPVAPSHVQICFVDKQRNAAVVIGSRDLKTDVASKRKRER